MSGALVPRTDKTPASCSQGHALPDQFEPRWKGPHLFALSSHIVCPVCDEWIPLQRDDVPKPCDAAARPEGSEP